MKIDAETLKKQVILHLPYVLFLLVFAKLGEAVRLAPGADASQKLLGLSEGFALAFQSMWPGAAMDWLIGLCGAAIMRLAVYLRGKDAKKYRKNVEYGSARWGNKADIAFFITDQSYRVLIRIDRLNISAHCRLQGFQTTFDLRSIRGLARLYH